MCSRSARGSAEAHPCLCSLIAKDLKENCAFAGIVCSNALVLPSKHLHGYAGYQACAAFQQWLYRHTRQSSPQHTSNSVTCWRALHPSQKSSGPCQVSNAYCELITLHGLQDWALHMRTTMLLSALSSSPLSSAGECTCTYDGVIQAGCEADVHGQYCIRRTSRRCVFEFQKGKLRAMLGCIIEGQTTHIYHQPNSLRSGGGYRVGARNERRPLERHCNTIKRGGIIQACPHLLNCTLRRRGKLIGQGPQQPHCFSKLLAAVTPQPPRGAVGLCGREWNRHASYECRPLEPSDGWPLHQERQSQWGELVWHLQPPLCWQ